MVAPAKASRRRRETIREESKKLEQGGGSGGFFNWKNFTEGHVRLAPIPEDADYGLRVLTHYMPTPGGEKQGKNLFCPNIVGDPCPVCAAHENFLKTAKERGRKSSDSPFRPRLRYWYLGWECDEDGRIPKGASLTIYAMPVAIHSEILKEVDKHGVEVADPEAGCAVAIEKTGRGLDTRYSATVARDGTPLSPNSKRLKALIAEAEGKDLEAIISYDLQALSAFAGEDADDGEDDDDDYREIEDDDDDDDADIDEDDGEEEEEDDDLDDGEEDPDEDDDGEEEDEDLDDDDGEPEDDADDDLAEDDDDLDEDDEDDDLDDDDPPPPRPRRAVAAKKKAPSKEKKAPSKRAASGAAAALKKDLESGKSRTRTRRKRT